MGSSFSRTFLLIALMSYAINVVADCPEAAPGGMAIATIPQGCEYSECPNGLIHLSIVPLYPPYPTDLSHRVQLCDVVEWSFGDGTTQTVTGIEHVAHEYPNPGNYVIEAKVTNAKGHTFVSRSVVIATSPSSVRFLTKDIRFTYADSREAVCWSCVEAREGSPATITILRELDLTRSISAWLNLPLDFVLVRAPLTFAPGVTEQTISLSLPDDHLYTGIRFYPLRLDEPAGGTLARRGNDQLMVIDDDPAPALSIEPDIVVHEGDSDLTPFSIQARLDWAMGVDARADTAFREGSATWDDLGAHYPVVIHAGGTAGVLEASVRGDAIPEADETFRVELTPAIGTANPAFGVRTCTVTILNDDAALDPPRSSEAAGTDVELTLDIGSPYVQPETAVIWTSDEHVVRTPQSVIIPAGATKVSFVVRANGRGSAEISASVPGRTTRAATVTVTSSPRRRSVRR